MADMDSPAVVERARRDRADAMTLKVTATPEYFVNGRQMPSFGEQQLMTLIGEELLKAR
jgi:protein-disulfide isomerase